LNDNSGTQFTLKFGTVFVIFEPNHLQNDEVFFCSISNILLGALLFSQNKVMTHKVQKGETIIQIAQKYQVTPYDIYQLNPDAQSGLKPNTVLLIIKQSARKRDCCCSTKNKCKHHSQYLQRNNVRISKTYDITEDLKI
jgi:hypothetical protein